MPEKQHLSREVRARGFFRHICFNLQAVVAGMMSTLNYLDPHKQNQRAVLLVHGLGANCSSWTLQFDTLGGNGFRPIAPDLPGFGSSAYDGKGWSIKRSASLLAELVDELGVGPVDVVGLSMGGVVAQQFVLDFPQKVHKLVLVSSFCALRPSSLSEWGYFFQRAMLVHLLGLKTQSSLVARRVFPHENQAGLRKLAEEQISSADPRAYRAAMRGLGLFNSTGRLNSIHNPTLVVSGEDDSTVRPERQAVLANCIRGARQVIIEQAGHALTIDQFEGFNALLLKFLLE